MNNIFKSASKLVFIIMAIATCLGFFMGRLSEANYMLLAGAAFTFYFSNKGESSTPFAGK